MCSQAKSGRLVREVSENVSGWDRSSVSSGGVKIADVIVCQIERFDLQSAHFNFKRHSCVIKAVRKDSLDCGRACLHGPNRHAIDLHGVCVAHGLTSLLVMT